MQHKCFNHAESQGYTEERAHFWLLNHIYPSLQTEREYSYKFTS